MDMEFFLINFLLFLKILVVFEQIQLFVHH